MSMTQPAVVTCEKCGARNRVVVGRQGARCGNCGAALQAIATTPVELTDANFRSTVLEADLPVLVDLWAPWCGPCRMLAPTIEAVARRYAGKLLVGKLNTEDHQRTAASMQVTGIPTLVLFKEGRPIARQTGLMSPPQLDAWLRQNGIH